MRVAIASGKGGTGKTLVATNLAHLANANIVDLDVEEPNCYLFFPNAKLISERNVSRSVPSVDLGKCTFCRKCAEICEFHAIAVLKDKVLVFEEMCHDCDACYPFCPENAICKKEHNVGKVFVYSFLNNGKQLIYGKMRIGEASAVPLIRDIKKQMPNDGLTIIDCPPGTSCPAVESVIGANYCLLVTEPTPFGLHDLRLAVQMVKKLGVTAGVLINKHGINGTDIESFCESENIPIIARLPFNRSIAENYSRGLLIMHDESYRDVLREILYKIYNEKGCQSP